jgi:FkbM family methyltransferase
VSLVVRGSDVPSWVGIRGRLVQCLLRRFGTSDLGRKVLHLAAHVVAEQTIETVHSGHQLVFTTGTWRTSNRGDTFARKEPDTLRWIDELPADSVLWDIGANVGVYTVYAAVARRVRTVAFEPSPFNLEFLARNVKLNDIQDLVTVVPIALTDRTRPATLSLTSTEWGEGANTFGERYGQSGTPMLDPWPFPTVGITADEAVTALCLPPPTHMKIDVDGIEGLVVSGATRILGGVRSVLVERPGFAEGAELVAARLTAAGLTRVPNDGNERWDRR